MRRHSPTPHTWDTWWLLWVSPGRARAVTGHPCRLAQLHHPLAPRGELQPLGPAARLAQLTPQPPPPTPASVVGAQGLCGRPGKSVKMP